MTQEEKELLLKDLCARLPYNVMIKDTYSGHYGRLVKIGNTFAYFVSELNVNTLDVQLYYVKPYLRPMSSMSEKEHEEFDCACLDNLTLPKVRGFYLDRYISSDHLHVDWLISHHFDYRGLIPMGLALEAPKGMYK